MEIYFDEDNSNKENQFINGNRSSSLNQKNFKESIVVKKAIKLEFDLK